MKRARTQNLFQFVLMGEKQLGPAAALAIIALLGVSFVKAQTPVPPTVVLKPAFVGGQYDLQLTKLLPPGTSPLVWTSVPNSDAPDGTKLETPLGVSVAGQVLTVRPTYAALKPDGSGRPTKTDPYFFELKGDDQNGNVLTVRFSLLIKPFGIDETRLSSLKGTVASFSTGHEKAAPAPPDPPFVLATSTADEETIVLDRTLPSGSKPPVAGADLGDVNLKRVLELISNTVGTKKKVTERTKVTDISTNVATGEEVVDTTNFQAGDYLMVHIIVWKPAAANEKADAQRQLWALFKAKEKDKSDTDVEWEPQPDPADKNVYASRVFGSKRVAILLINFTTPSTWDVKYTVALNQRIPTPVQNLLTLAANIPGGGGPEVAEAKPAQKNVWGARMMLIRYPASDMLVKVNSITNNESEVEQAKDYSKKYLNEGRYHWDVSIGLPVKTVRELQYKTDANNKVTTEAKDRQNAYAFLNLFVKPVDLSGERFLTPPHFVFGVPIATKPLHHPFAGLGYGVYKTPIKFNIFAGLVFNRERVPNSLNVGSSATSAQLDSDLRTRWVRKFMFGINFPISQIKDAIKNK